MKEEIYNYIENFEEQTKQRFRILYELIYEITSINIDEKLWAKIPSFYVGEKFIRLIPFKNHINIEAKAVIFHKDELPEYKITPKGMLQIFHNQQVPCELLKIIFKETFEKSTI
ncbi:DUF1801 domain-containing protein [Oceanirhabdus seepicola]|uniref:DUF1801 domain-containing protein n=1 Tax=Oceanirhabdus seepicola TaxID=2828781 RepID=A0A9J6P0Z8_9CLOT|nr:DUF1801 domain-containing protein [Oceanirhabdus seepicola]MCM1989112.1 DUF1801 domain-containing protein [Oceanirhabdus seepicola]